MTDMKCPQCNHEMMSHQTLTWICTNEGCRFTPAPGSPPINLTLAAEIRAEQDHGRQKYGRGPDDFEHDDSHAMADWHVYISTMNTRASLGTPMERRQYLVKTAGLAISAIEAFDRKAENTQADAPAG